MTTKINSPSFDGKEAVEMLQRLYTMDYGSRKAGSRPPSPVDDFHRVFFLDFISIIGFPLKVITRRNDRFFDNVIVSFKHWQAPYSAKHVDSLAFELENRTFRLASAATREVWYIVMHPIITPVTKLAHSRQEHRKRLKKSMQSSAMQHHHAKFLAAYIKQVFLAGDLLGEGIEPSWTLGGGNSTTVQFNKWTIFQQLFMDGWIEFIEEYSTDPFWRQSQPAFHAYDYGANIEIELNAGIKSLPAETRLRRGSVSSGSEADEADEMETSLNQASSQRREVEMGADVPAGNDDYQTFYTQGLRNLRTELEAKYMLENIDSISYALAVDVNCLDGQSPSEEGAEPSLCLLADRNKVAQEFNGPRDFTFYPLAFHPAYGNFSSPRPPAFLRDNVLAILKNNMSIQNDGADVLSCGYFQGYSGIKRAIRPRAKELLATKGTATAAMTIPDSECNSYPRNKVKRDGLLRQLKGQGTPEDPDSSKPFMREHQRINAAINTEEFGFRMEQVISIRVCRLNAANRSFLTVLRPIFQLIRFYLLEESSFSHVFHCFQPSVYPGVLASFARLFGLAMDEMLSRFELGGSKALGAALAEGVAALDRLGSYCFTGFPTTLMGSVLGPLGAIDGMRYGAWPFINPRMLSLEDGEGTINVTQWPRREDGRPILMHVASLAFHYGPEVAASRHSYLWFQELGGLRVDGPRGATKYLEELFRDLWIPQTMAFIQYQLNRSFGKASRRAEGELERLEGQRSALQCWMESDKPFTWV